MSRSLSQPWTWGKAYALFQCWLSNMESQRGTEYIVDHLDPQNFELCMEDIYEQGQ